MVVQSFQSWGQSILNGQAISDDSEYQEFQPIPDVYRRLQGYYDNDMYHVVGIFNDRVSGLPVTIREIHNPVQRIVDWYAGRIAPVDDDSGRIPFASDTENLIRNAVLQAFSWGNNAFNFGLYVRTGATLGDVFAEVVSDPDRQKVYPKLIHPRYVTDIEWNDTGDVIRYRIDIPIKGKDGRQFTWGKVVDKAFVTTLRDGKPHGYDGEEATMPNPWGFVPAIWVQHRNVGSQHGAPCFAGVMGKIDELNSVVSEIDDYILKFTKQYVIIGTDNPDELMSRMQGANTARSAAMRSPLTADEVTGKRERLPVAAAKQPVSAVRMIENMGLADAVPHRDRLLQEIEQDLPEITLNEKLLGMQQVTGPGARQLVLDVQQKLNEAAANYDNGVVRLGQMCISMAAQCIRDGVWPRRKLTDQQRAFSDFTPDSYDRGELAFSIAPRTLIAETIEDKIAQAAALERLTTRYSLKKAGLNDEEADELIAQIREAATFNSDLTGRAFSAGSLFG